MSDKYILSIGDGVAKIFKEGKSLCVVDDFVVWEVEGMIVHANEHDALVSKLEHHKKIYHLQQNEIVKLEEEKRNLQIKLGEARACCGCIECLNKKCSNNLWKNT
jgi:hypothetical protein